jgi:hypothetical protein
VAGQEVGLSRPSANGQPCWPPVAGEHDDGKWLSERGVIDFRAKVGWAKIKQFAADVHDYAGAVTRAATDAGWRELRLKIVENLINDTLGKPAVGSVDVRAHDARP